MVGMEYVTKKIPKKSISTIRRLQAKLELKTRERQPEARVIQKALEFAEENESRFLHGYDKKYTLLDIIGFIKNGPRTDAARDLDEVVYGDVNRT